MIPIIFPITTRAPFGHDHIYEHFHDVLDCALRFAQAEIIVISDKPVKHSGITFIPVKTLIPNDSEDEFIGAYLKSNWKNRGGCDPNMVKLQMCSVLRWYYIYTAICQNWLPQQFICIDWEVLVLSAVEEMVRPFLNHDLLCADMHPGKISQSPICVLNFTALEKMIQSERYYGGEDKPLRCDMGCWTDVYNTGDYRVANVGIEHKATRSVIDGNVGDLEDSVFLPDRTGYKQIHWHQGKIHFMNPEKQLVRVHMLHCWGAYKQKVPSLVKRLLQK